MNVGEFLQRLSYGPLADLSIGTEGSGAIAVGQEDRVVSIINTALTEIYSRFSHNRYYVELVVSPDRRIYKLDASHLIPVDGTPTSNLFLRTLDDTPFSPVVSVVEVTRLDNALTPDVDELGTLGINARGKGVDVEVQMVSFDTIFLPEPVAGDVLRIEYRGRHTPLSSPAVLSEEIILAPILEEVLETRVAAGIYSAKGGELHMAKSRELMARYERLHDIIKDLDLLQESSTYEFDRLHDRGFI